MHEDVYIAWAEDETSTQLQRVFAETVLTMTPLLGTLAGCEVVATGKVQQTDGFQADGLVSGTFLVDEEGEGDSGLLTESLGVVTPAQADGQDGGACFSYLLLVVTQLRDMLAAENSPIVAEEDDHRPRVLPIVAQTGNLAIWIR